MEYPSKTGLPGAFRTSLNSPNQLFSGALLIVVLLYAINTKGGKRWLIWSVNDEMKVRAIIDSTLGAN
jgi:hypothetical protein